MDRLSLPASLLAALGLVALMAVSVVSVADTLFLKDGRVVEGLIKYEDTAKVTIEFEYGSVDFLKKDVREIRRATEEQSMRMRARWDRRKEKAGGQEEEAANRPDSTPRGPRRIEHFVVTALINKRIPVRLLLDTGATFIILSKEVGQKLGIDEMAGDRQMVQLQLGDGRRIQAAYVSLSNVKVEQAEASDVAAAVLLESTETFPGVDGMLGMSFLSRFNFKVDQQRKRLILEKF